MNFIEQVFAIRQEILNCVMVSEDEAVNEETGEIIDVEALQALEMDFRDKVYNIGMWIKKSKIEADAIKAEKMRLAKRQAQAEKNIESLTSVLDALMQGEAFKDPERPLVQISYRKSKKVVIDDISAIPEQYLKVVEPEANKAMIKTALKSGEVIVGCHEEECSNIQIK